MERTECYNTENGAINNALIEIGFAQAHAQKTHDGSGDNIVMFIKAKVSLKSSTDPYHWNKTKDEVF